ncbi:glycosyltransferase family 2 protein [Cryobacterium mannosilyticum]|uniref:cellulose synthase (UDP-forming) n=1 Tax=Cryobacterium mannosilyticum TaxID=1259190 RepID=A0A4R8W8U5_9MICO|nr:glycosyltransferase [Cryobacterium mannosilyticum]TFC04622.1 glycosyltransferase [Cryobacterium mannosilyticum]
MILQNWQWMFVYPAVVLAIMETLWIVSRKRPGFGHRTAIVISLLVRLIYLVWRVLFTIPTDAWWNTATGLVLLAVEVIGFAQSVTVYATLWRPHAGVSVPLPPADKLPSVDVFIATYNEPVSMLRMTIAGAVSMRYPRDAVRIYVCDDGGRDEVRQLAEQYGATHITREDHAHAKAGNLNNALGLSEGELIVTLDADMVPRPDFLEHTVGRFQDERLGFVQSPQAFYNEDPFQYNLFSGKALPNEQDFFMRTLQGGKSRFNAVMYVGSNTVFRRTALETVGGFAVGVITEDLATGMLIQAAKYRTEFVPEIIAAGLAPENLADMLKQRDRWCRGNIQTARKWNPLTLPGLTPMQRWLYSDAVVYWYFGVFKLIYILAPILFLLFGVTALDTSVEALIVFWLPSYLCVTMCFVIVVGRRRSHSWSNIYELALTPAIAFSAAAETLGLKVKAFNVTPKGVGLQRQVFHWRIALPHLVLLVLSAIGLLNALVFSPQLAGTAALFINVFWCLYFVVGLALSVALCVERPRLRSAERTRMGTMVTAEFQRIGSHPGVLVDLSLTGARVTIPWSDRLEPDVFASQTAAVTALRLPDIGAVRGTGSWIATTPQGVSVGFRFDPLTPEQTVELVRVITESPNWVRGDEEEKALLVTAGWRAVRGASRTLAPWRRSQVRVASGAQAILHPVASVEIESALQRARKRSTERAVGGLTDGSQGAVVVQVADQPSPSDPTTLTAVVEDIGFGGCRLSMRHRLQPGSLVIVEIPGSLAIPEGAEVRWVKRRGLRFEAGLQFDRSAPNHD